MRLYKQHFVVTDPVSQVPIDIYQRMAGELVMMMDIEDLRVYFDINCVKGPMGEKTFMVQSKPSPQAEVKETVSIQGNALKEKYSYLEGDYTEDELIELDRYMKTFK